MSHNHDAETSAIADFIAVYRLWRRNGHPRRRSLRTAWHCVFRTKTLRTK